MHYQDFMLSSTNHSASLFKINAQKLPLINYAWNRNQHGNAV